VVLVDTCGWVEWLTEGPLAETFGRHLAATHELLVPTLVQYELAKWVTRERDEALAMEVIALTQQAQVVELDTNLALAAADAALAHRLAMADAVIYACARSHTATVVTSDAHFEHLPGVQYLRPATRAAT
jgi:predicted nucleic acid-binding protein